MQLNLYCKERAESPRLPNVDCAVGRGQPSPLLLLRSTLWSAFSFLLGSFTRWDTPTPVLTGGAFVPFPVLLVDSCCSEAALGGLQVVSKGFATVLFPGAFMCCLFP